MGTNGGVGRRRVEKLSELPLPERRSRLSALVELLSGESQYVRRRALELIAELSVEYPGAVADEVGPIAELLDEPGLPTAAARTVAAVATAQPAAVEEKLPLLVAALDSGGPVTVHVTSGLAAIGDDDPAALAKPGILDKLSRLLGADSETVRTNVTKVIGDVAAVAPDAVADAGAQLGNRLTDSSPTVQRNAAYALGRLTNRHPTPAIESFAALCTLLDSEDQGVRSAAAYALTAVAAANGIDDDAIEPLLDELRTGNPTVRQQAAFVVASVARENPAVLEPHIVRLTRECVDTDPRVRRNLFDALATLEAEFPDAVETARDEVSDALETADISAASTDLEPAALRALAGDGAAPEPLGRAAREAVVLAGQPAGTEPTRTETQESSRAESNRNCPNCGERFDPDATFCAVCGTSLE